MKLSAAQPLAFSHHTAPEAVDPHAATVIVLQALDARADKARADGLPRLAAHFEAQADRFAESRMILTFRSILANRGGK